MKCPGCNLELTESIQRRFDRVRVAGEHVLTVGEFVVCHDCGGRLEGRWDLKWSINDPGDQKKMGDPANCVKVVVLQNEGGLAFCCERCAHKQLKVALEASGR